MGMEKEKEKRSE